MASAMLRLAPRHCCSGAAAADRGEAAAHLCSAASRSALSTRALARSASCSARSRAAVRLASRSCASSRLALMLCGGNQAQGVRSAPVSSSARCAEACAGGAPVCALSLRRAQRRTALVPRSATTPLPTWCTQRPWPTHKVLFFHEHVLGVQLAQLQPHRLGVGAGRRLLRLGRRRAALGRLHNAATTDSGATRMSSARQRSLPLPASRKPRARHAASPDALPSETLTSAAATASATRLSAAAKRASASCGAEPTACSTTSPALARSLWAPA